MKLLNIMCFDFIQLGLSRNISIPNSNLSYGAFEHTNFTNANLTNVNFASTCLKDANFKGAHLNEVSLGEWLYLQFEELIQDKTLRIWDVASGLFAKQIAKSDLTKKTLNLAGANIEDVVKLSDKNLILLHQQGACRFSEKE